MRGRLAAAAAVAVALVAAVLYFGGFGHLDSHRVCVPHIVADEGVAGVDVVPLSGSRACPARYRISVRVKPGYRLEGVEVGGKAYEVGWNAAFITVTLEENATVRVYTRRLVYSVELTGNVSGPVLVNGSRVRLPWRAELPYGAVLNVTPLPGGCLEPLNHSTVLRVTGSVEARLAWRVRHITVGVWGNYSGSVLVNGTRYQVPFNLTVPCGASLNITPVGGQRGLWRILPLNGSFLLTARENVSLGLYWLLRCDGVLVTANVPNASALVDGVLRGLPYCARPPVVVEGVFGGPAINGTHRWWLGWCWVEERGKRWWWSYGVNGSRLRVEGPANVTLYYLPGLRGLPYVERVLEFPKPFFGMCMLHPGGSVEDWEVKDGWLHLYNPRECMFKGENKELGTLIGTFWLSPEVGAVEVEVNVTDWPEYEQNAGIEVFVLKGGTLLGAANETNTLCAMCEPPRVTRILFGGKVKFILKQVGEGSWRGKWVATFYRWEPTWGLVGIQGNGYDVDNYYKMYDRELFRLPKNGTFVHIKILGKNPIVYNAYLRVVGVIPVEAVEGG